MKISIDTRGLNSLANDLKRFGGKVLKEEIRKKVSKSVDMVRDDARQLAPISERSYVTRGKRVQPGRLKKSVKAMMHKERGDIAGGVYAYYPDDNKGDKYYAFAPEYGTTHGGRRTTPSRPHPYLRVALLKNENRIVNEIGNAVDIAINKAMYGKSLLTGDEISAIESAMGGSVNWADISARDLKGKK